MDGEKNENDGAKPDKKKRKTDLERHLYPCPHCGELILDHFTVCPKCGGEVTPKGYRTENSKRDKIIKGFQIGGTILSVVVVIVLIVVFAVK